MPTVTCEYCGAEFEARTKYTKMCHDCYREIYKSTTQEEKRKRSDNPNERIMEEVRQATARGLSYGEWKGRRK